MNKIAKTLMAASFALSASSALANTSSGNIDGTLTVDAECSFINIPAVNLTGTVTDLVMSQVITVQAQCLGIASVEHVNIGVDSGLTFDLPSGWQVQVGLAGTSVNWFAPAGEESLTLSMSVTLEWVGVGAPIALTEVFQVPLTLSILAS